MGKTLVYGFGNPGRIDDGLGPECSRIVESWGLPNIDCDSNYQLFVEDAEAISNYDRVIFVDASVDCKEPFEYRELEPEPVTGFTSHGIVPQEVVGLAKEMYATKTESFVLAIRGYEFDEFKECLSDRAKDNLKEAVAFLQSLLVNVEDGLVDSG